MFTKAIVRIPGKNFEAGLTTADLGLPDYFLALQQHQAYCEALRQCGLEVIVLPEDLSHPDSTFVEDTAVILKSHAIFTRPGAPSRVGEVEKIRAEVIKYINSYSQIEAPGTLDGGDICEAGQQIFIGISERTNETGAKQFAELVARLGYMPVLVDIRQGFGILHLKSGLAYLGEGNLVVIESLTQNSAFENYHLIRVDHHESYAANCVRVNDKVLIAKGFPRLAEDLEKLGYELIALNMSEFQKMDGGLSCLSLRF